MKFISFIITMPNVGSWNGKFSGESNFYCVVHKLTEATFKKENTSEILGKSFRYNFGDGWCASVEVKQIDSNTATAYRKKSSGFMGYEWMIKSILNNGKITLEKAAS